MNIDKLIQDLVMKDVLNGFGSLMNIDKLIQILFRGKRIDSFGSLMNIDKLIQLTPSSAASLVLAL